MSVRESNPLWTGKESTKKSLANFFILELLTFEFLAFDLKFYKKRRKSTV